MDLPDLEYIACPACGFAESETGSVAAEWQADLAAYISDLVACQWSDDGIGRDNVRHSLEGPVLESIKRWVKR